MHSNRTLFPALIAVGGTLAATPATAIELGDINVESTLGQPLRASIAYALAPNEQLSNYCVTLHQGPSNNGLPAIQSATVSVAGGVISLTGRAVVREPLMSVRVNIACPYTPKLSREYMLFIDPALPAAEAATTAPVPADEPVVARTTAAPAARAVTRRPAVASAPIAAESRYRVQPGDTLSGIAARIENRPVGLWSAVSILFEANPDAFINNDPNKLKAGSWLAIPDFGNGAATVADRPALPAASTAATVAADSGVSPTQHSVDIVDDTRYLDSVATPAPVSAAVRDLEPGDFALDSENPFVDLAETAEPVKETNVVIGDTSIEVSTESASPNVPVARIADEPVARLAPEQKTNWLLWMIGGGIALMAGLLLFGRRSRYDDADPYANAEPAHPMRRSTDSGTVEALKDPDFDLEDDSPTAENLALDADLAMGTGLDDGTEVDVREDFGFAATTDLDFDLSDVDEDQGPDTSDTDMMPIPTVEQLTILDKEVLPDDEDYDMSVIVDATKMPRPEDATEQDLKAVAVDNTEEYTLDQEIDYQILEQDYEDELTATQALNKEIEKAAAELAERIESEDGAADADDETTEMPLATVTEIDATSRLAPETFVTVAPDETGVECTQEMIADDKTVEMPKSDNDDTVEMTVESGKVDTKAG